MILKKKGAVEGVLISILYGTVTVTTNVRDRRFY